MLDISPQPRSTPCCQSSARPWENGDIDAAVNLFLTDCYWRDLVTFTWNLKTLEGHAEIRDMLKSQLAATRSRRTSFRTPERPHPRPMASPMAGSNSRRARCPRLWPYPPQGRPDLDAAHHHERAERP